AHGVGRRRVAADGRPVWASPARGAGTGHPRTCFPPARGPIRFRRRLPPDRVPVAAVAAAGAALQPERAAGASASLRTRDDRKPLPPVPGRSTATGALLQRLDRNGVRAR